jgi:superfamily II DNA or RNA helicase
VSRIFDNIDLDLAPHLVATYEASQRMDAAVGYFNLRGWAQFGDAVDAKPLGAGPVMRVLVGMTLADPHSQVQTFLQAALEGKDQPEDEIDRDVARTRLQQALNKFRTQLMRGIPNAADLRSLRALQRHLTEGRVAIKLSTRRPMHGKTYLCHREDINSPIVGFVGSSNLTMSGLKHNYELNVDVLDFDGAKKLDEWFQARWDDRFTIDITAELIEIIEESWAAEEPRSPYEVYLKVCYHLSRDVREGLIEYSLPPAMREQLLEYQVNAVQTLARRVVTRGGTMLGDVVGLGKTITAVAVALMLREEHGHSTLVVCPKNLVKMWQGYLDAYDVPGRVVPYSLAARDLPEMRRYQFVIIDESHTMRSDTRLDYKAIHDYIRDNNSKVLLLTATPYNIRFRDVANQLALFIDDDDDLGLQPVTALGNDPRLADRVDGKTNTLLAFRKSEEPDDWKRLMTDHLVRRTRSFIKNNYALIDENGREYLVFADGSRFFFPERTAKPIEHSFGDTDPAGLMASDNTLDVIEGLALPRYNLADYLAKGVKHSAAETELIERLEKGSGHLIGFVRTGLYKRLSSCGHSFVLSLQRHLARNEMYLHALDHGLDLPVGTVLDPMLSSSETDLDADDADALGEAAIDYNALRGRNPRQITWARTALFTGELAKDLRRDIESLTALLDEFGDWTDTKDSKIDRLVALLEKDHLDNKVLIFTEYKDTANYVAEALALRGIKSVGLATGDTSDPTALARRFSPRSNALPGEKAYVPSGDELRVLVATDVLSEGQNLQDAHIVVNYDLPWAIIRLIQRAGRVDRVGQQSAEVLVYSFFHENVENVLSLRQRIKDRLQKNAEVFGSDERFFGTAEETKAIEDLYNGKLEDDDLDSEVDASSLAFEVWNRAETEDPNLALKIIGMPDMVFATRPATAAEHVSGVVCYVRTHGGMDGYGLAQPGETPRLLTGHEALRLFACDPDTPALEARDDHFDLTAELAQGPLAKPASIEGRLRGIRKRVWNRLNGTFTSLSADVADALDALFRRPLTRDSEQRLRTGLATRGDDESLADLVTLLHRDGRLVIPDNSGSDPVHIVCTMGITS